ncbi:MAG TPA: iron chelate uptake ABC transporter family permease subunit [Gemmatimonadales bacterium]|jgi:zinc/manganese transport system permease protein|nr:iron chelate uptake ABC transporter family permease subunit [Gemmatimonadales bacterium]
MDLSLFLPPLVACLVIVAIHSYLGLHVIAREVIFVDLSLAQMAALGSAVAILAGSQPDSTSALVYALVFTTIGAGVFALTRTTERGAVPQEAIIGIVYVMASAAAILVADRTPRGGEAIKDILVGSLLWVTWPVIFRLAGIYALVGLFHWFLRRRFLTISFAPETAIAEGWKIRWWDFLFYLSFGLVITFSVPIAGVLLVFSFLVVPAAIAFQFTRRQGALAAVSWLSGALASAMGLWISFHYDLPTGPVVVCMFGVVLLLAYLVRRAVRPAVVLSSLPSESSRA